ncbi:hypothetical protein LV780_14510 [Cereibacter azotoformans]|uniref:Uncharacterized protein n=1 Tax=Cereibacter azotoformans TaxID=43057 RepID=A0A2T5K8C0_9RHOB|nr:hypothetical protein [Cereibacter azotoformans]AXQ94910.1 hypothetical protein D0Z66_14530 [Cereibacter sphaeroides]MBO4170218.1 hypothetical protein [Cereibacter azotoformans]PTR18675.1 hypothetical protein C8J28_10799 [Cereibacter azotoformans]UIJ30488.1 hypothetical protein LV780_14510 [Cereibacter azotoformans]
MYGKTFAAALLGAALTLPALASADEPTIKSIDVETSLSDLSNAEAAAHWSSLDTDLETAIAALLVGRLADEGMDIKIDMNEVALANFVEAAVGAESTMAGTVNVIDLSNNTNFKTFDLTVTMAQAAPLLPPDTDIAVIAPTSGEVYSAMVATFAAAVVDRIEN